MRHAIHEIEVITEGYQKWRGATPSFNKIDVISTILVIIIDGNIHNDNLDRSKILEPNLWARKYLIAASVSWVDFELFIRGINLNRFNSIAIHRNNQLALDTAIIVLIIIINEDRKIKGLEE